MSRHSSEKSSSRSQHHGTKQQSITLAGGAERSRRNAEQQQQQHTSLRSKFNSHATQLRLTIFIILTVALVLVSTAFFSTNWLEVERRYYGSKFKKLGLWRMCFNSFSAPDDFQFKKFYVGCRWIFADEYRPIRKFLLPGWLTINDRLLFKFKTFFYKN